MDEALKSLWSRCYQVGVVVRDMNRAIQFYESLGVGPFLEGPSETVSNRMVYGKPAPDIKIVGRLAQMGQIQLELLQPASGQSVQKEFLDTRGEGAIHIDGYSDNLERDIAIVTKLGFPVISYGELSDGGKFAYFDTRRVGGVILELEQRGSRW